MHILEPVGVEIKYKPEGSVHIYKQYEALCKVGVLLVASI